MQMTIRDTAQLCAAAARLFPSALRLSFALGFAEGGDIQVQCPQQREARDLADADDEAALEALKAALQNSTAAMLARLESKPLAPHATFALLMVGGILLAMGALAAVVYLFVVRPMKSRLANRRDEQDQLPGVQMSSASSAPESSMLTSSQMMERIFEESVQQASSAPAAAPAPRSSPRAGLACPDPDGNGEGDLEDPIATTAPSRGPPASSVAGRMQPLFTRFRRPLWPSSAAAPGIAHTASVALGRPSVHDEDLGGQPGEVQPSPTNSSSISTSSNLSKAQFLRSRLHRQPNRSPSANSGCIEATEQRTGPVDTCSPLRSVPAPPASSHIFRPPRRGRAPSSEALLPSQDGEVGQAQTSVTMDDEELDEISPSPVEAAVLTAVTTHKRGSACPSRGDGHDNDEEHDRQTVAFEAQDDSREPRSRATTGGASAISTFSLAIGDETSSSNNHR